MTFILTEETGEGKVSKHNTNYNQQMYFTPHLLSSEGLTEISWCPKCPFVQLTC